MLTRAYEKIANTGFPVPAPVGAQYILTKHSEPMTATKAANAILGFIERCLQMPIQFLRQIRKLSL
jgi:hypothetical protein